MLWHALKGLSARPSTLQMAIRHTYNSVRCIRAFRRISSFKRMRPRTTPCGSRPATTVRLELLSLRSPRPRALPQRRASPQPLQAPRQQPQRQQQRHVWRRAKLALKAPQAHAAAICSVDESQTRKTSASHRLALDSCQVATPTVTVVAASARQILSGEEFVMPLHRVSITSVWHCR